MGKKGRYSDQSESLPPHSHWLGTDWGRDAEQCSAYLRELKPDWLVVDHYALDHQWEGKLRATCKKIMVIDDLADRRHNCDLLLDQTYGQDSEAYRTLVPAEGKVIVGTKFALLRPEFAELRNYSLSRRTSAQFDKILITMGGVDKDNVTGKVLDALGFCELPPDCKITVVMGGTAPWLQDIQKKVKTLRYKVVIKVNVDDMAKLMADSDLAIGAAGSTTWERCCLGLPSMLIALAVNQKLALKKLNDAGAAVEFNLDNICTQVNLFFSTENQHEKTMEMSHSSSTIVDGHGVNRVIRKMELN